jgi:acyl carrier protein
MNARDKTKNILAQSLGIEPTDIDEASLLREDLELDAVEITEIVNAISNQTGLKLRSEEIEEINTVGEFLDWIDGYSPDAGI